MNFTSILNATRLTSGARGYEGHVLTRQQMAHVLTAVTHLGYRAAYRAAKSPVVETPIGVFQRGALGGRRGWCIWLA